MSTAQQPTSPLSRLSLIAALDENGVIGHQGGLPWHLPKDLKRFKSLTTGHTMVMGRRTHESIGRALPDRRSLVLSRDLSFRAPGIEVVSDLGSALTSAADDDEIFVIGGYDIFRLALPKAQRLYLTRVHAKVDGDVFFPQLDLSSWRLIEEVFHPCDERHAFPFSFRTYDRVETAAEAMT